MRPPPAATPPREAAAVVAAIAATIPPAQLPLFGFANTVRKLELRNYATGESVTVAQAPDLWQLQPAAMAAVEAMQRARTRAKAMLRKEGLYAAAQVREPALRSTPVDRARYRAAHSA
jgi:hypothetical protein